MQIFCHSPERNHERGRSHQQRERTDQVSLSRVRLQHLKQLAASLGIFGDKAFWDHERRLLDFGLACCIPLTLAPANDVGGAGTQGVAVTAVDPNGPAAEHGIQTGDVILDIGGKTVSKPAEVRDQLAALNKEGKHSVLMRVKSGDTTKFVAVPLGKA
jgi:membrane-associated protease RseP (regulator of RpoE activity)